MGRLNMKLVGKIKENNLEKHLIAGNYGLEKEGLRVTSEGELSNKMHPQVFGDKLDNPYIKTDFGEAQMELITPINNSIDEMYNFLRNLNNMSVLNIEDEYLWNQSMPAILPEEEDIQISRYGKRGKDQEEYREMLSDKYGKKVQVVSGIHYNFSFSDEFIKKLYETSNAKISFREYRDNIYLKMAKGLLKNRWLMIYLTGSSPVVHETYDDEFFSKMNKDKDYYYLKNSLSLRNGFCGYKNEEDYIIDYSSTEKYLGTIERLLETGVWSDPREFYSVVRLKAKDAEDQMGSLKKDGISYIELRMIDLNPLAKEGISIDEMYAIKLLILHAFFTEDLEFGETSQEIASKNHSIIADDGLNEELYLYNESNEKVKMEVSANKIIDEIEEILNQFELKDLEKFVIATKKVREKINCREKTLAYEVKKGIEEKGYIDYHMEKIKKYKSDGKKEEYKLFGFENFELSTQILLRDSLKRGLKYEILDKYDNFISLSNGQKTEWIKQATKTSKDAYSTVMVMENKVVTKKILGREGINVPRGRDYDDIEEALEDYEIYKDKKIVIKPKSTNFGIGITIFKDDYNYKNYSEAINIAFEHDYSILVEEFVSGKEYRFVVIGDKVEGVLNRIPANIKGDGVSSITELVKEKNKDHLRGEGYKTPLEKLKLGELEKLFLETQGKDFGYIPKKDEVVYIRENSNISTGGDSIDYTDDIIEEYKEIAVRSSKTVKARFCGVDIMIDDINEKPNSDNYSIIELNFNPAVHIHCYPYQGKNRDLGEAILKELELI